MDAVKLDFERGQCQDGIICARYIESTPLKEKVKRIRIKQRGPSDHSADLATVDLVGGKENWVGGASG